MKPRILIASHERSGTHFLINSLAMNFGYDPQQIDLDLSQQIDWRDTSAALAWLHQFENSTITHIFKSHHAFGILEPISSYLTDQFTIFYVYRDGRDVMTSFWRYLNNLVPGWGPQTQTVGQFMRAQAVGGITQYQAHTDLNMLQRWVEHTQGWTRDATGVHLIAYEDLHRNFDATISKVGDVLGKHIIKHARPGLDAPSSLPWRGEIGNWQQYFSPVDNDYFRIHAGSQAQALGYEVLQ